MTATSHINTSRYQSCRAAGDEVFGHSADPVHDQRNEAFARAFEREMRERGYVFIRLDIWSRVARFAAFFGRDKSL